MKVKCIKTENNLTLEKEYSVVMFEDQGSLIRIVNDNEEEENYPAESFEIIEFQTAKCLKAINVDLTEGETYKVVSVDVQHGECRIIDNSGEDYIYSLNLFEILK